MIKSEPTGFHAHIYFDSTSEDSARSLKSSFDALQIFGVRVYDLVRRPVGPHPQPMFEIEFQTEHFSDVLIWLMLNRGAHSVFIHPITGDEYRDHFDHAVWLGKELPLNAERLKTPTPVSVNINSQVNSNSYN